MPNAVAYTFVAVDKFSDVTRRLANRTGTLSEKMSELRTEAALTSGAVGRLVGGFRKAGLGLIATGAALSAAQIPFLRQFAELEQIQVAFEQIVGSVEKGRKVFKSLQKFQQGTPFDLVSIKTAAQTLLTFGSATEDLELELTALGNIAAASGARIGDLANVFGKVQTSGRVTQDVLNQLAIRGVNVMEIWSKKTGIAVDRLSEVVSKGAIPFSVLRETILDLGVREGGRFTGIMEEQAKRLAGAWVRLGSAMVLFKASLGKIISEAGNFPAFFNFLAKSMERLTLLLVKFAKDHPFLTKVMVNLGTIFVILGALVTAFSIALQVVAITVLPLLILRFLGFKAVMSAVMFLIPGLRLLLIGLSLLFGTLASASLVVVAAIVLIPLAIGLIIWKFREIKLFFGFLIDDLVEIFKTVTAWIGKIFGIIGKFTGLTKLAGFFFDKGDININVSKEMLTRGEVDLSGGGGDITTRNTSVIDVNLNAPKGVIQSVKSKTTGDGGGPILGLNMAEAG